MALYPGAKQRHISHNYTRKVTAKDCAILHTTASAHAQSMYSWFSNPNANASSHFHVDNDGDVEQYLDTAYMSWANTAANPRAVTIETQGDGTGPWTKAQVVAIVKLLIWICREHNIAVRQMASSARNQTGIGWHRLGCDGNFPALPSILAGRSQRGGESWTSARGKVCPGDDRIKQIPGIIADVKGGKPGNVKPAGSVSKPAGKKQPTDFAELYVDGKFGPVTVKAVQVLMRAINTYSRAVDGDWGKYTQTAVQEWLKGQGKYKRAVDGSFGKYSVTALQEFLRDKGLYPASKYVIDGDFGPATVRAFQRYLNTQNHQ